MRMREVVPSILMKPLSLALLAALAALPIGLIGSAQAKPSLGEACARFSSKLNSAVAAGDIAKAQADLPRGQQTGGGQFQRRHLPQHQGPVTQDGTVHTPFHGVFFLSWPIQLSKRANPSGQSP